MVELHLLWRFDCKQSSRLGRAATDIQYLLITDSSKILWITPLPIPHCRPSVPQTHLEPQNRNLSACVASQFEFLSLSKGLMTTVGASELRSTIGSMGVSPLIPRHKRKFESIYVE